MSCCCSDEYAEQKSGQPLYADSDYTLFTGSPRASLEATESLHGRTRVYLQADEQTLLKMGIKLNLSTFPARRTG